MIVEAVAQGGIGAPCTAGPVDTASGLGERRPAAAARVGPFGEVIANVAAPFRRAAG